MLVSLIKKYVFLAGVTALVGFSFNAYAMSHFLASLYYRAFNHGLEPRCEDVEALEKRQKRIVAASHLLFHVLETDDKKLAGLVEYALACDADVNARDRWRNTPLHRAKRVEAAALLIKAHADVNAVNNVGRTPLHSCQNDAATVSLLIDNKAAVNARDAFQETPLHGCNDIRAVCTMVKAGARVDVFDHDGNTVLHSVVGEEVLRYLIDNGAGVCVRSVNQSEETPLHKYVAKYDADENAIRLLLNARARVNAQDCNGKTPLHEAANGAIARLLIDHKAYVNMEEDDGSTPLHRAKDFEMVIALCENGALIEKRNNEGLTPLLSACERACWPWDLKVIDALLTCGADVHAKDNDGQTIVAAVANTEGYWIDDKFVATVIRPMISKLIWAGASSFNFTTILSERKRKIVIEEFAAFEREKSEKLISQFSVIPKVDRVRRGLTIGHRGMHSHAQPRATPKDFPRRALSYSQRSIPTMLLAMLRKASRR